MDQFERCPYKYKLRYIDKLKPLFNCDASNALVLGTAVHTGIEKGVEVGVGEYVGAYPVLTDLMVNEIMKLDIVIPQVRKMIPAGEFEIKLDHPDFVGYIDLLTPVEGELSAFDMYDFKYSKNKANYLKSPQLSIYKYFFELLHPGKRIRNLNYLLVPKTAIRQKKTETLRTFRQRIFDTLDGMAPELVPVEYDLDAVVQFLL
ncbi:MAG: PD-(D/E)XK nuclease family protein, partial [Raoultibacter sp.]